MKRTWIADWEDAKFDWAHKVKPSWSEIWDGTEFDYYVERELEKEGNEDLFFDDVKEDALELFIVHNQQNWNSFKKWWVEVHNEIQTELWEESNREYVEKEVFLPQDTLCLYDGRRYSLKELIEIEQLTWQLAEKEHLGWEELEKLNDASIPFQIFAPEKDLRSTSPKLVKDIYYLRKAIVTQTVEKIVDVDISNIIGYTSSINITNNGIRTTDHSVCFGWNMFFVRDGESHYIAKNMSTKSFIKFLKRFAELYQLVGYNYLEKFNEMMREIKQQKEYDNIWNTKSQAVSSTPKMWRFGMEAR